MNVDIFAQYIFSRISHRALDVRENLTMLKCFVKLDALTFSSALQ